MKVKISSDTDFIPQSTKFSVRHSARDLVDIVTFGHCEMRPKRRELIVNGATQTVPKKIYDCLLYLLENRDRVVSKDDLEKAIWGGVCVSDSVIARAIMKARRVVGDEASASCVIKTIHGIGYRFIADVTYGRAGDDKERISVFSDDLDLGKTNILNEIIATYTFKRDSRHRGCEWAYSGAIRAVSEGRWSLAARLFELAINLGYDGSNSTVILENRYTDPLD